jgi:hypothetical protein
MRSYLLLLLILGFVLAKSHGDSKRREEGAKRKSIMSHSHHNHEHHNHHKKHGSANNRKHLYEFSHGHHKERSQRHRVLSRHHWKGNSDSDSSTHRKKHHPRPRVLSFQYKRLMDRIPALGLSIFQNSVPENIPFCIKNKHSSLYLVPLDARISSSPVIQRKHDPHAKEFKWEFVRRKDSQNQFFVRNIANPFAVLDVLGASKENNTPIHLSRQYGNKNQQFTVAKGNDGSYTFKSVHSEMFLGIENSSTHADSRLVQVNGAQTMSAKFTLEVC